MRQIGRLVAWVAGALVLLGGCDGGKEARQARDRYQLAQQAAQAASEAAAAATAALEAASAVEARRIAELEACRAERDERKAEYRRHMAAREYWPAAQAVRLCALALGEPALKTMLAQAEVKSYVADIENPKASFYDKRHAVDALIRDYPEVGKKYLALQKKLDAQSQARVQDAEAQARSQRTMRIGATADDVRRYGWGEPHLINSTTTVRGTSEQWVYGVGRYLYFDNGVLVAIQR